MAPRQEHRVRPGSRGNRRETVQGGERRVRLPVQQRRPGTRLGILVERRRRRRIIVAGIREVETTAVVLLRGERRARERRGRSVHRRRSLRIQDRTGHRRRPHETHRSKPARAVRLARPPRGTRVRRAPGPVADGGGQGATKAGTRGAREGRDASVHGTSQRDARAGIAALRASQRRRRDVSGSFVPRGDDGVVGSRRGGCGLGR